MNWIGYIPAGYHGLKCLAHHMMRLPQTDKNNKPIYSLGDLPEMHGILADCPAIGLDTKLVLSDLSCETVPYGSNSINRFGNGRCIRIHRAFFDHEPAGSRFFIRKAAYELANEVPYISELVKSVATLAAAIFCDIEQSLLGQTMRFTTICIAELAVEKLYVAKRVADATAFTLQRSTQEELLGALNIVDALERQAQSNKKSYLRLQIEQQLTSHGARSAVNHNISNKIFTTIEQPPLNSGR